MKPSDYPFESFNARALTPRQVALGFVPPDAFQKLCRRRHSIVAGPRGSGKTTLLKMLQVGALRSWTHPLAPQIRQEIDFTGVFVPADRTWSEQLCAIGRGRLSEDHRELLSVSAFTTQILRALISALVERATVDETSADTDFRAVRLRPQQERELTQLVGAAWECDPPVPTLLGLRSALARRLVSIHQLASKCALLSETDRNQLLASQPYLHVSFLSATPAFLDVYEQITGSHAERWALLFDELELAPPFIRKSLTQALRSVDDRLLFKLAIAPFSRELEESINAASDRNDYDLVRLWYPQKEDGYLFSRSLVSQILARRGIPGEPESVFGETVPEPSIHSPSEYARAPAFKSLASKDPTFRDYLSSRNVQLGRISLPREDQQAATLRKVVALVFVRDAHLSSRESSIGRRLQRSRKSVQLYCGMPALLAVSEGNPRWLIGLVDAMLEKLDRNGRVQKHVQDRELTALLSRFSAYLRTIPSRDVNRESQRVNVYALIDKIGSAFTREIVEGPFNPDPAGTFLVDSHTSEEQLRAIEQAIYAGAVLYVPESGTEVATGTLRGKRFRLSYLLAPKYKLPLILLRPKSLASLLNPSHKLQNGLFDG